MRQAAGALFGSLLILLCGFVPVAQAQEATSTPATSTPSVLETASSTPPTDASSTPPEVQSSNFSVASIGTTITFVSEQVSYPARFAPHPDKQSAFKTGDNLSITVVVTSSDVSQYYSVTSATADLSAIGLGSTTEMEFLGASSQTGTHTFLLRGLSIPAGTTDGVKTIYFTATDEFGASDTFALPLVIDTERPTITIVPQVSASTPLNTTYPIRWSGNLDGTGSGAKIYRIKGEEISSDGVTVLGQHEYQIEYDAGEFREVGAGAFTNVALAISGAQNSYFFPPAVAYLRFTFIGADEAGNQESTTSALLSVNPNTLPEGTATTSPYDIVYNFPWNVWGGVNGAFPNGKQPYPYKPFSTTDDDRVGVWDDVAQNFTLWHDATRAYTFTRLETYLGIAGIPNLPQHPASAGTVEVRIYAADAEGNKGALVATSLPINASTLYQLQNTYDCMGTGFKENPYTANCIAEFSFPTFVTLSAGQYYLFEIHAAGVVTPTQYANNRYYYPGLFMQGSTLQGTPPGVDGVQKALSPNTGSVYMRLLGGGSAVNTKISNIIFLPGFEGSRLYTKKSDGTERRLWDPRTSQDIRDLALRADGTSALTIYTRDVIGDIPATIPFKDDAIYSGF
ncbi:MAG: hypothetical protein AAB883_00055, partial [Patescibacteria group bacterium]